MTRFLLYFIVVLSFNSLFCQKNDSITYWPDGKIKSKVIYKKNLKNGEAIHYYKTGKIKRKVFYINNCLIKYDSLWFENGNLKSVGNNLVVDTLIIIDSITGIDIEQLVRSGDWKYYYMNGALKRIEFYRKGEKDLCWKYYSQKNQLIKEEIWDMGELKEEKNYSVPE